MKIESIPNQMRYPNILLPKGNYLSTLERSGHKNHGCYKGDD